MNNQQILDCVIVGGGLVGGLTALLLAQDGVQSTVLDAAPILDEQKNFAQHNSRTLALTQATIQLLKVVDLWQDILQSQRFIPYTGMQAWNVQGYGDILLGQALTHPMPHDWLGVMVEPHILNVLIQKKLVEKVQDYRTQSAVQRIEKYTPNGRSYWQIQLANGEILKTWLLIGADGANSLVRQQALIGLDVLDYGQSVISCALTTEHHHQHVARQMYNPTPFALLPMADIQGEKNGYLHSLAWTLPTEQAQHYLQLSPEQFQQQVYQASHAMLGLIQIESPPMAFPIKARSAEHYVEDGLALIGDAAHTIHPLAGQGMNLGCLDAGVLCDVLLNARQRGTWANLQTLRRYENQRRTHNVMMMHSMSAMGFGEKLQTTPLGFALNWGRKWVSQTDWVKQLLIFQASGRDALRHTRYAIR